MNSRHQLIEQIQEDKLRKLIRLKLQRLLKEASDTKVSDAVPHRQTGINVLEVVLKKVIPSLEATYKSLTTSKEQRLSFRIHILNGIKNALLPEEVNFNAGQEAGGLQEAETKIELTDPDQEKFIPVRDVDREPEETDEDRLEKFTLPDTDTTGRNFAMDAFKQVSTVIIEAYESLANAEDKNIYFEYLLTNLKLYFDKFEQELSGSGGVEPQSPGYTPPSAPVSSPMA